MIDKVVLDDGAVESQSYIGRLGYGGYQYVGILLAGIRTQSEGIKVHRNCDVIHDGATDDDCLPASRVEVFDVGHSTRRQRDSLPVELEVTQSVPVMSPSPSAVSST